MFIAQINIHEESVYVATARCKMHFGLVSNVTFSLHAGNQSNDKLRSRTNGNVETRSARKRTPQPTAEGASVAKKNKLQTADDDVCCVFLLNIVNILSGFSSIIF